MNSSQVKRVAQSFMSNQTTQISRGSTIPYVSFHIFEVFNYVIKERDFSQYRKSIKESITFFFFDHQWLLLTLRILK